MPPFSEVAPVALGRVQEPLPPELRRPRRSRDARSGKAHPGKAARRGAKRKATATTGRQRKNSDLPAEHPIGHPRATNVQSAQLALDTGPKRLAIGTGVFFLLLVLLVGGIVWYANWRRRNDPSGGGGWAGGTGRGASPSTCCWLARTRANSSTTLARPVSSARPTSVGGQRSDVIIVARIVPATHQVKLLSIPRDTYVNIPGDVYGISGPNRINAAYNNGPTLLVKTISDSFHIPVNYYAEVNFQGFAGMVNALGGIGLDFPVPVKDTYSWALDHPDGLSLGTGRPGARPRAKFLWAPVLHAKRCLVLRRAVGLQPDPAPRRLFPCRCLKGWFDRHQPLRAQ